MKTRLVIEFSERWIKVGCSNFTGLNRPKIEKIILEPIDSSATAGFGSVLRKIFEQVGVRKGLEAVIVLPRNKITVRRLDLPSRDSQEIEQMLSLNVIRQVPYPKEDIIWGYQNLGFDGISNNRILLAIAHRTMLRDIFNAFTPFGVLPESILLSSQGAAHCLYDSLKDKSPAQGAHLVLDVDYNCSDFLLINNQQINSSVVIAQGSQQLKLEDARVKFIAELKQALLVFNNEIRGIRLTKIFITGAVRAVQAWTDLEGAMISELNLKPQFVAIPDIENLKVPNSEDLSLSAVVGFSYGKKKEDIRLILPEAQIKKEIKLKIKQFFVFGILLIYIFIIFGALSLAGLHNLEAYRDNLDVKVQELKKDTDGLADISQKLIMLRKSWDARQSVLTYLYELSRTCPEAVVLTDFSWSGAKNYSIRGYASQIPEVFSFVGALNKTESYKNAATRYTRKRKIKDKEGVDFEIGIKKE